MECGSEFPMDAYWLSNEEIAVAIPDKGLA